MIYTKIKELALSSLGVDESRYADIENRASQSGQDPAWLLVAEGLVTEEKLFRVVAKECGLDYVDLVKELPNGIDPALAELVGVDLMRQYNVVPLEKKGETLTLATSEPESLDFIDEIGRATNLTILPVVATNMSILDELRRYWRAAESANRDEEFSDLVSNPSIFGDEEIVNAQENNAATEETQPIFRLLSLICELAADRRASDIHIDPTEKGMTLRFRIDGELRIVGTFPENVLVALISRIKVVSRLRIDTHRVPQDGSFIYRTPDYYLELRVSILPSIHGESCVMRVIDKNGRKYTLDGLGMTKHDRETFQEMLKHPYGLLLVTGPTGSGKTTTLYTALKQLISPKVNVITIEDPVEEQLIGAKQVQINTAVNLDFATVLRAVLRHDPDILLIGEIRDNETADIAVRAAITGHLVLASLHTNSAISSIPRLYDMGVERFMINTAMIGAVAQRLVKRVCPHCATKRELTEEEAAIIGLPAGIEVAEGKGCEYCGHTGYLGRSAVYENFVMDADLRKLVGTGASTDELQKMAVDKGMITLRENCKKLVESGTTSVAEALRVIFNAE